MTPFISCRFITVQSAIIGTDPKGTGCVFVYKGGATSTRAAPFHKGNVWCFRMRPVVWVSFKRSRSSVHQVQAISIGANPKVTLPVLQDSADFVVQQTGRIFRVMQEV